MLYLTRKVHFNAAHRLFNPKWSDEKNFEVFGMCANPNWHGHNFDLEVTVKGIPNPDTAMVINFKDLNQILKDHVIEALDHKNLNIDVPFLEGKIPSAETLIVEIWKVIAKQLDAKFPGVMLHALKLYETDNSLAEYYGEGIEQLSEIL